MRVSDIITQMRAVVPEYTDFFSQKTTISSATQAAGVITIDFGAAHGLSPGDMVKLEGIRMLTPVTSITQTAGVATVETTPFHDLTLGFHTTLTIQGANEGDYNGTFPLLDVTTTNKATFTINPAAPASATGTMFLVETRIGYDGFFTVLSTPTANTITVAASSDASFTGSGNVDNAFVFKSIRISGSVSIDRAVQAYSEMNENRMWAFVVSDGFSANNERNHDNDANYQYEGGQHYRQKLIVNFSVYVMAPSQESIASRPQVDDMEAVRIAFFHSLLGAKFDSGFNEGAKYGVTYLSDIGDDQSTPGYYVHRFQFQTVENINRCDIVENKNTVAWRTFDITAETDLESHSENKKIEGNLPKANT